MKKCLKLIIAIVLIISIIVLTVCVLAIKKYHDINKLCRLIDGGYTDAAIEQLKKINNVNSFTAPIWTRKIYNMVEYDIDTPLIIACENGNSEVVAALLEKGADPNLSLDGGWSPIEVVYTRKCENRAEIAKMLLEHGAHVDLYRSYSSALFVELESCIYKSEYSEKEQSLFSESIFVLLDNGASPVNEDGDTIIHYLAYGGQIEIIKKLSSDYGYLFEKENIKGETPLDWAKKNGMCSDEMERLLTQGTVPITQGDSSFVLSE